MTARRLDYGPEFRADPYSALARFQEEAPLHRVVLPDGLERWMVTRYDDVVAVLSHPGCSNDIMLGRDKLPSLAGALFRMNETLSRSMINQDPPRHTALRKLIVRAFTARRIEDMRPRVHRIAGDLLAELPDGPGPVDLSGRFVFPLPVTVICELMGVPLEDYETFRTWMRELMALVTDEDSAQRARDAADQIVEYLRELIAVKRREPDGLLLGALIAARDEGRRLDDAELLGTGFLLLAAGHETTVNLISCGVALILATPGLWERMVADRSLVLPVIDELLRLEGPISPGLIRYAIDDIPVAGQVIPRGSFLLVALAAANRDPRRFSRPDELDPARDEAPHLAFGHGIHYCLGARLARLEAEAALTVLLDRYPRLTLAVAHRDLPWRVSFLRGLQELPVLLEPG